jgi:hypothetical protein
MGMLLYLGLAVCVFTWGLQYKLSLYDPPQAFSHQFPQAKLLSRNEQTGTMGSPLVVRTKTSSTADYTVPAAGFFVLLLALSVLNPQESGQRGQRTDRAGHIRRGLLNSFFVRPPPILA